MNPFASNLSGAKTNEKIQPLFPFSKEKKTTTLFHFPEQKSNPQPKPSGLGIFEKKQQPKNLGIFPGPNNTNPNKASIFPNNSQNLENQNKQLRRDLELLRQSMEQVLKRTKQLEIKNQQLTNENLNLKDVLSKTNLNTSPFQNPKIEPKNEIKPQSAHLTNSNNQPRFEDMQPFVFKGDPSLLGFEQQGIKKYNLGRSNPNQKAAFVQVFLTTGDQYTISALIDFNAFYEITNIRMQSVSNACGSITFSELQNPQQFYGSDARSWLLYSKSSTKNAVSEGISMMAKQVIDFMNMNNYLNREQALQLPILFNMAPFLKITNERVEIHHPHWALNRIPCQIELKNYRGYFESSLQNQQQTKLIASHFIKQAQDSNKNSQSGRQNLAWFDEQKATFNIVLG